MAKTKRDAVRAARIASIKELEAVVEVSSTVLGREAATTKKIKIRPFVTDTATVSVKYGMTINMGDYESARVDVFLSAPCYKEEMVGVYNQIRAIADKLIVKEVRTIKNGGE